MTEIPARKPRMSGLTRSSRAPRMMTARTSVRRPAVRVIPGMISVVSHSATAETRKDSTIRFTSAAGVGRHSQSVSNCSL